MAHTFIVSTPHSLFRPLTWQGIQAQSAYDQLAYTLLAQLGEKQAGVLAEPVSGEEVIDWYAKAPGKPFPLNKLTFTEQEQALSGFRQFGENAAALAAKLKQVGDSNSQLAGALLELALSYPSQDCLYALKTDAGQIQPLLIGWGFALAGAGSEPEIISRLDVVSFGSDAAAQGEKGNLSKIDGLESNVDAPAGIPLTSHFSGQNFIQNQEPAVVRHISPFPWALLAFLLAVLVMIFLLFWLLPRLNPPGDFGFSGCSRAPLPATAPETQFNPEELYRAQGREEAMRNELERLRREYEMRLWMCEKQSQMEPIIPLEPEPQPEPTPPVPDLTLPELPPDPPPQPESRPKPEMQSEEAPRIQPDAMVIPDNPDDLSFLEGCWYAQTGLRSTRTRMPISVKYCFDGNGNGRITLTERDKSGREMQMCAGGAQASLSGNVLFIHDLGAICPDGSSYEKERITCRNADQSKALCTGVGERTGKKNWVDRPFTRVDR